MELAIPNFQLMSYRKNRGTALIRCLLFLKNPRAGVMPKTIIESELRKTRWYYIIINFTQTCLSKKEAKQSTCGFL